MARIDVTRRLHRLFYGESIPDNWRWTINLKTAKALGLTIPPWVLAQADQLIE